MSLPPEVASFGDTPRMSLLDRVRRRHIWIPRPKRPAQYVVLGFAVAVSLGTSVLLLPVAAEPGVDVSFVEALFTATSAVTVNGLVIVDTGGHWSLFGELMILLFIQVGGFGIMTSASLLGLMVARRLGLRTRLAMTSSQADAFGLRELRGLLFRVAAAMLVIEAVVIAVVWFRLMTRHRYGSGEAAYSAVFHGISAVNNAGFSLHPDSLMRFADDPVVLLTISAGVLLGGIGFPVLLELWREYGRPRTWSLHTKVTLATSGALLLLGSLAFLLFEWGNTLAGLHPVDKVAVSITQGGVMPRSGGFNAVDYSKAEDTTLFLTDGLMFIGAGSASTAGGIKVTTFALLLFAIIAEARGNPAVEAFGRRVPSELLRQALSVALLSIAFVVSGTMIVMAISGLDLDLVLFEVISAYAVCGASAGVAPILQPSAQYVLVGLMFIGRVGSITVASALALRERRRFYQLPEERTIIG